MARFRTSLIAAVAAAGLFLTACSDSGTTAADTDSTAAAEATTITIEDNHGTKEIAQPIGNVAATDNRAFELLDRWDVDLVAAPVSLVPFTVTSYKEDENIVDLGTHREPNLEALTAAQPELIVNGQRFAQYYDEISTLNPDVTIIELDPRDGEPLDRELIRQAEVLGEVFGEEEDAATIVADFSDALERAKTAYEAVSDKSVMAVNVSGGNIGYIAPSVGRTFGPIFDLLGMTPALEVDNASSDHEGDDINVEAIAASNPDILLVMDRDGGTTTRNTDEYVAAEQVIEDNEALANVTATTEGSVYYAPADTYTNENIITYTEILNGLADLFEEAANNN
ncbi:iron ABC transporter substrate-binding protein [Corynebacterium hylobatis]|uniref:Iron ABC transporter substrate-binding protein n=1 Tax=Corynebacterium hylobatis TaxID=1859290 RepID=A0A3R9ZH90_9CORY|nr:ABC transporter substrate-binding protein [Corynebacterium hylobatis]RSZ61208.1 iron ABC transporter substrate-binding protein [Corynebacterium hylobatis]